MEKIRPLLYQKLFEMLEAEAVGKRRLREGRALQRISHRFRLTRKELRSIFVEMEEKGWGISKSMFSNARPGWD